MITKEHFKLIMKEHGFNFVDDIYSCPDGSIMLYETFILCYNKVIFDEFQNYVTIHYPDSYSDDLDKWYGKAFANDFNYHLSYNGYRDYMNLDNKEYQSDFYTEIIDLYFRSEINFTEDEEKEEDD